MFDENLYRTVPLNPNEGRMVNSQKKQYLKS